MHNVDMWLTLGVAIVSCGIGVVFGRISKTVRHELSPSEVRERELRIKKMERELGMSKEEEGNSHD